MEPRAVGTLVRTHTTWGLGLLEVLGVPVTHPHTNLFVNTVEGNNETNPTPEGSKNNDAIPYGRFQEVVSEKNSLKDQVSQMQETLISPQVATLTLMRTVEILTSRMEARLMVLPLNIMMIYGLVILFLTVTLL